MENQKSTLPTNDKDYAPLLLACSYNSLVAFVGETVQGSLVIWEFSPRFVAKELISKYELKVPLGIPEKDLADAKDFFWRRVNEVRSGK